MLHGVASMHIHVLLCLQTAMWLKGHVAWALMLNRLGGGAGGIHEEATMKAADRHSEL